MSAETMIQYELAKKLFSEGLYFIGRADYVNAEIHFRKTYEILPENISVINNLAGVLVKLNHIDEAKQLTEISLKIDNTNALTWLNLGICFQASQEPERAANAFRRALALDDTLHQARRRLRSASSQLGAKRQQAKRRSRPASAQLDESSETAEARLTLLSQFLRRAF